MQVCLYTPGKRAYLEIVLNSMSDDDAILDELGYYTLHLLKCLC